MVDQPRGSPGSFATPRADRYSSRLSEEQRIMPEPTPDRFMNTRWLTTLACILITAPGSAGAQKTSLDSLATADTALRHVVRLRDGSTLVGRVIAVTWD